MRLSQSIFIRRYMDHYKYQISDPIDSRFQVNAFVDAGELALDIRTELETGERSTVLRGPDQLRKILAHFVLRYDSLRVCWTQGENLKDFNRAVAAGATHEEAVLRTWTGHQLALSGYSNFAIRTLEGSPCRYTKVVVCFRKP
jgi:hypothetical protein